MITALLYRSRLVQIAVLTALSGFVGRGIAANDAGAEFFEKQVRPILAARCLECHSGRVEKPKGGLRLDSRAGALKGGETGPAIVPGKPKQSLLVDAINYGELYQMPPKAKLPAEEIAVLTKWIEAGAPWPEEAAVSAVRGSSGEFDLAKRKAEHWCWQPIRAVGPPVVKNEVWVKNPLDRFILGKLEAKGLSPAPPADERALVRRAYFDLTGLPPPVNESGTYEAVVDRLLASPHFGERWGRHWLDLVRYAESRGHEFDYNIPNAFEYRDYVIRALNADVPYDQLLIEHLAGDLLEQPRLHPADGFNESIIGTGFWFLGEWCHSPVDIRKDECDRIDNMLDVFSKTFLGVTVACARCHDHKFDAISQRDYYALAGYLQSASYRLARFETWQQDRAIQAELSALEAKYRGKVAGAIAAALRPRVDELAAKLVKDAEKLNDELGVMETDLRGAEVIVDYANPKSGEWMADGPTFGRGPVLAGQLVLPDSAENPVEIAAYGAARRDWFWGEVGLAKQSENDPGRMAGWLRAGRTLKTPTFTLQSGYVHYLIEGAGHAYAAVASHAMNNGPLHAQLLKETGGNSDLPTRWITHDLSRYIGERVHLEFSPKEDEDLRVLMVVEGRQRPAAPANRANRLIAAATASGSHNSSLAACRELISSTLDLLAAGRLSGDGDVNDRPVVANWLVSEAGMEDWRHLLKEYLQARDELSNKVRHESRVCLAMWDGTPVDENLLIRGNHKAVGPLVARRSLEALHNGPIANGESGVGGQGSGGSGRLELARQLIDPRNPLVSRVIVNRVWQHLMGRGIVPSVDNVGVMGQPPTHPELLDYLAAEFMRDGWSLKRLIRRIALSSAYRQGSGVRSQESEGADPQNLLFHRQNVKRLEGEAIRDAMLAVSGRLDRTLYGSSVPIHLTPFMQGRGRPKESGPLDGAGRRSIYIAVRRNFLSPMMLAFDTPVPFTTIGRRNISNVPAQALTLMNDPFVVEQSRYWAQRLLAEGAASPEERVRRMYLAAFHRDPTQTEMTELIAFIERQIREANEGDGRVWSDVAHVIFNAKEFVFVE